jgi:hypothetical protein
MRPQCRLYWNPLYYTNLHNAIKTAAFNIFLKFIWVCLWPYLEPDKSRPHPHTLFCKVHFKIISMYSAVSRLFSSSQILWLKRFLCRITTLSLQANVRNAINRIGLSNAGAPDVCSGDAGLLSRMNQWISLGFTWISSVPSGKRRVVHRISHKRFLSNPFQFIYRPTIQSYTVSILQAPLYNLRSCQTRCGPELGHGPQLGWHSDIQRRKIYSWPRSYTDVSSQLQVPAALFPGKDHLIAIQNDTRWTA